MPIINTRIFKNIQASTDAKYYIRIYNEVKWINDLFIKFVEKEIKDGTTTDDNYGRNMEADYNACHRRRTYLPGN